MVVTKEWLYDSLEKGEWQPTENYIDPLAKDAIMKRRGQKKGVLSEKGLVYVCKGTRARLEEVEAVVSAAGGKITKHKEMAAICIGGSSENDMSELNLYDSIMRGELRRGLSGDGDESEEF